MIEFPEKIFVTGTDTDIGKTVVSATLCKGLGAGYWKPVQAGRDPLTDTERVKRWTGHSASHFYPETYSLEEPMSPHAAADLEEVEIRMDRFEIPEQRQKHLIVEGAGGLIVPINWKETVLDLIVRCNLPVLLVGRSGLGTLNHTLMSLEVLAARGITPWGVVLNGPPHRSNEETIRYFGQVERLFTFPEISTLTPDSLKQQFEQTFLTHAS